MLDNLHSKKTKRISILERPEHINAREGFGHWEGNLVTGPRDGQNGAYLTLIERKTRCCPSLLNQLKKSIC